MARRIAEIEIEPALPGGGSVGEVLGLASELCQKLDHGDNVTRRDLYNRLDLIATELQQNTKWAANDRIINTFAATLEEFWRHLAAYNQMTIVERLLNCRMTYEKIADVNKTVEEMITLLELRKPDSIIDQEEWSTQNEVEQIAVASIATKEQVRDEVRGEKEKLDSIVLLQVELDRMRLGTSKLPTQTRAAIERVYDTIAGSIDIRGMKDTPAWFIPEADVKFSERKLGEGGFATVHSGKYREHTHVIVKLLLAGTGALDKVTQISFTNEVKLWHDFRHPHIIRMIGANHVATRPFIVMDEARQGNLKEYLLRSPENRKRTWQLLYEAAQGVEFLHSRDIVHADLKLNNILVSDAGNALISDFGLSQIKNKSKSKSMTRRKDGEPIEGGLRWMAPERFKRTPQLASDVYSFAMTILEAFLGEPPYSYLDDVSVRAEIEKAELPPRPDGMSEDAWKLVKDMTALEPTERIAMTAVVRRIKVFASEEQNARTSATTTCASCYNRLSQDAKFCQNCGTRTSKRSAADLLREISSSTSSGDAKTLALQKLYRLLAFSEPPKIASSDLNVLHGIAGDPSNALSALYAFGCLRTVSKSPNSGMLHASTAFDNEQSVLCTALRAGSWKDLFNSDGNQTRDEVQEVELVELLLLLKAAGQSALRGRIPSLAAMVRESENHPSALSATLAALVALTQGSEENLSELRDVTIGAQLVQILVVSSNEHDRLNAAVLLSGLTEGTIGADQHINADDVRVLVSVLHNGSPALQQHVVLVLANIAKDVEGARLIGLRGGIVLLIELMQPTQSVDMRCCALRALSYLVADPTNEAVFIHAGGVEALEAFFTSTTVSDDKLKNTLWCLKQIVENEAVGLRIASNNAIVTACVGHLEARTKEHRQSAVSVLLELVKTHKPAVEEIAAIDNDRGFRRLIALIKEGEPLAEEALLQAIKTLLRGTTREVVEREPEPLSITTNMQSPEEIIAQHTANDLEVLATSVTTERVPEIVARAEESLVSALPDWFIPEPDTSVSEAAPGDRLEGSAQYQPHDNAFVVRWKLPGDKVLDSTTREAIRKKMEVLCKLRNPFVSRVVGANSLASHPFVVMEHPSSETVMAYLLRSRLHRIRMWRLLYQAALGVAYLHSHGIKHGDLRLSNVLVSSEGDALVTGYNLDRGEPQRFASDVFSLAMCVIEAFTGESPYLHLDDESVIATGLLPPRPSGMTDEQWRLVEQMTTTDPQLRMRMRDVLNALERFANDEEAIEVGRPPICVSCGALWDFNRVTCVECETEVSEPHSVVTIESNSTLRQTIAALTRGTPTHRVRALVALSEYAFADASKQEALISAGAVSLVVKLLVHEGTKVRLAAAMTLSAIASMNTHGQDAASNEHGIELLLTVISTSEGELTARSVATLSVLIDQNMKAQETARSAGAISVLASLSASVEGVPKAGTELALRLLGPPSDSSIGEDMSAGANLLLCWAVQNLDFGLVHYLVANGADANTVNEDGQPLLHVAVERQSLKLLEYLVKNGAAIDSKNQNEETALHVAAAKRDTRLVSFLTSNNADPNVTDKDAHTPLYNSLFTSEFASVYDLEAASKTAFVLCAHGAVRDPLCQKRMNEVVDNDGGANRQTTSYISGLWASICYYTGLGSQSVSEAQQPLPIEAIQRGENSVKTLISAIERSDADKEVYRLNIVILGAPKSGKSSFVCSIADKEASCAGDTSHLVDVEHIPMPFTVSLSETSTRCYDVTIEDYTGRTLYQAAQVMFFSRRKLYLLCVDLEAYEQKYNEDLGRNERFEMMRRYLSDQVFRWVRQVLVRQPDARVFFIGTKRERLSASEDSIRNNFISHLSNWAKTFLEDFKAGNHTGTVSTEAIHDMLQKSLDRMKEGWITVNNSDDADVEQARKWIKDVIFKNTDTMCFKMLDVYAKALEVLRSLRTGDDGAPSHSNVEAVRETWKRRPPIWHDGALEQRVGELVPVLNDPHACCDVLRTLDDIGDIISFEKDSPATLRNYTIVDPMIPLKAVRELISRNDTDDRATRYHGKLAHETLVKSPFWGAMSKEILRAFKELLHFFQLAHPEAGEVDWDSDLIVPAFRKGDINFRPGELNMPVSLTTVVRWEYEVSIEVSEALFDWFAVESYVDEWQVCGRHDCIEISDTTNTFVFLASIGQSSLLYDKIRLEVTAHDHDTCWRYLKFYVRAMQNVLTRFPGLNPRTCRIYDDEMGHPETGVTLSSQLKRSRTPTNSSVSRVHRDLSWYNSRTSDQIVCELGEMRRELVSSSQLLQNKMVEVLQLVVAKNALALPPLWIFKCYEDVGELRLLSDISGICFHDPLEIQLPKSFFKDYGSLLQNGMAFVSAIADHCIGLSAVKQASDMAKSALDRQVERAKAIQDVLDDMESPGPEEYKSTDQPMLADGMLRELLRLHGETTPKADISELSNLHCVAVKGKYLWASEEEVDQLRGIATPCNPRLFTPPSTRLNTSTASVSDTSAHNQTCALLRIETVDGFKSKDWPDMFCSWRLRAPGRRARLARGRTSKLDSTCVRPKWADQFTLDCVSSIEKLRECELHLSVERPSRLWLRPNKTLAEGVLKLAEVVAADSTRTKPVQVEWKFASGSTDPSSPSITLVITVPAANPIAKGA